MRTPIATLVCLLVAALVTLAGGMRLARRETQERHPADRKLLHEFAGQWQEELARLEEIYERDLEDIAERIQPEHPQAVRRECAEMCGVAACVLLPAQGRIAAPTLIRTAAAIPAPLPTISLLPESGDADARNPGAFYLYPAQINRVDAYGRSHGWISTANSAYRVWWSRSQGRIAAFVLDRQEIERRTLEHLRAWSQGPMTEARSLSAALAVTGPDETQLAQTGDAGGRPADLLLPLRSRFGAWQIAAWDWLSVRTEYDLRALTLTALVASVLALGGAALYREQRRAQILAEQRVSFVNRVSHELGTPLTNMLLNLDLAAETVASAPEHTRRRISLAAEETRRLARLVSNVLTFSRQERGALRLNPGMCVPDEVVRSALASFEPALARRGIALEFEGGANSGATLDADALSQIVSNLVSNVEKYAADGKWMTVRTAHAHGELRVCVEDRGPGIPRRDCDRIFLPFHRVRSRVNEGASGTGLGLAIARDLARSMSGELALVKNGPCGCIFELRIPAEIVLSPLNSKTETNAA